MNRRLILALALLLVPASVLGQSPHQIPRPIGPTTVRGNYNNAPPSACQSLGDLHFDLDSGASFECTNALTEAFLRSSSWSPLRFWVEGEGFTTLATSKCLNYVEGDFALGTARTCTTTAGVLETGAFFPAGVNVFASRMACVANGTSVTGTLELDVRWRKGDAPGTQTDSVASLSIPAASFNTTIRSATINSACPYGAAGCIASVHVKTALSAGSAISLSCDLLHASF